MSSFEQGLLVSAQKLHTRSRRILYGSLFLVAFAGGMLLADLWVKYHAGCR